MATLNSFSDRLRIERERLGLSQEQFAEKTSVNRITQGNYERGQRKPDAEYLEKAAVAGVDVTYLITGARAEKKSNVINLASPPQDIDEHEFTRLRHFGVKFSNGRGVGIADDAQLRTLVFRTDFLKSLGMTAHNAVAVDSVGDSNYPEIPKGQGVALVKLLHDGQIVRGKLHAFRLGDDLLIKKLYRLNDHDVLAVPANNEYDPILITPDRAHDFDLIGVVKWVCVTVD